MSLMLIYRQPFFAPSHEDPRWQAVLERLGRTPEQLEAIEFDPQLPIQPPS